MKLRWLIPLLLLALGILPAAILGWLLLPGVVGAFGRVAEQEALAQARAQQTTLMQLIESRRERTRNIALLPAPREILDFAHRPGEGPMLNYEEASARLRAVLSRWFRGSKDLKALVVLDRDGIERVRFEPGEAGLKNVALAAEPRHELGPAFDEALASGEGSAVVLPGGLLRLFNPIQAPDGTAIGMLTVDYALTAILSAAKGSLWVDGRGRELHDENAASVFDRFPMLKNAKAEPLVVSGDGGRLAWVPLVLGRSSADRLWIGTNLDESELEKWLATLWLKAGVVAAVLVLLLIAVARWVAVRIEAVRVSALEGLGRIIAGQPGVRFDWRQPEELRQLGADLTELGARHSAVNADLRRFTEILAHHLQEPVRIQVSYVQQLARQLPPPLPPAAAEAMDYITTSSNRLRDLLRDAYLYLVIDRLPPPSSPVDAAEALHAAWDRLAARATEAGATLETGALPRVWVTKERLADLFSVLISNAIEFRSPERPPHIRVEARDCGNEWQFVVSDNGMGIEDEYLERIFRVFERLHPRAQRTGTGIGLALARKIVECANGRITAQSVPGEGSAFLFNLPKAEGSKKP